MCLFRASDSENIYEIDFTDQNQKTPTKLTKNNLKSWFIYKNDDFCFIPIFCFISRWFQPVKQTEKSRTLKLIIKINMFVLLLLACSPKSPSPSVNDMVINNPLGLPMLWCFESERRQVWIVIIWVNYEFWWFDRSPWRSHLLRWHTCLNVGWRRFVQQQPHQEVKIYVFNV